MEKPAKNIMKQNTHSRSCKSLRMKNSMNLLNHINNIIMNKFYMNNQFMNNKNSQKFKILV